MIIESKTVFLIRIITWTNTQIGRTRKWESFIKEWYLEMMPQQTLAFIPINSTIRKEIQDLLWTIYYVDTFVKYVVRTSKYGQGKKCLSQMDYRLNKGDDAKNGKQRDFTTYHNDSPFLFFKILHLESLKTL